MNRFSLSQPTGQTKNWGSAPRPTPRHGAKLAPRRSLPRGRRCVLGAGGVGRVSTPVSTPSQCRAGYFMALEVNIPSEMKLMYQFKETISNK